MTNQKEAAFLMIQAAQKAGVSLNKDKFNRLFNADSNNTQSFYKNSSAQERHKSSGNYDFVDSPGKNLPNPNIP